MQDTVLGKMSNIVLFQCLVCNYYKLDLVEIILPLCEIKNIELENFPVMWFTFNAYGSLFRLEDGPLFSAAIGQLVLYKEKCFTLSTHQHVVKTSLNLNKFNILMVYKQGISTKSFSYLWKNYFEQERKI